MSKRELLNPTNSALILIDHQPQMAFGVQSIDRQTLQHSGAYGMGVDYAYTMVHNAPQRKVS